MQKEVLVVGAGPVGLTAALMLTRHDIPVRIIDQNDAPTTLSKALIVWKRTLQTLDPVIQWETFDERFTRAATMQFVHEGQAAASINLHLGDEEIPVGILIPQCDTESILVSELQSRGVEVERNTLLKTFTQNEEGVDCEFSTGEQVQTPYLLGCDGAHSVTRHTLGIQFSGVTIPKVWQLADVSFEGDTEEGVMYTESTPAGAIAMFPISTGRIRLIADDGNERTEKTGSPPTLKDVQTILDTQSSLGLHATELHWSGEYIVNERQAERYSQGRVFLAGDAAHVHSPAGGQGMNLGMQDAANLAWKIACVMKGSDSKLLDSYNEERYPIGQKVLEFSHKLIKSQTNKNPMFRIVNKVMMATLLKIQAVQHKMVSVLCEDVINVRESHLSGNGGGDMFPCNDDAFHYLRGNQATLFCLKIDENLSFGPLPLAQVISDDVVSRFSGDVLVRPDGYIAAVGEDNIRQWLTQVVSSL